jgi:hypothetical protein
MENKENISRTKDIRAEDFIKFLNPSRQMLK